VLNPGAGDHHAIPSTVLGDDLNKDQHNGNLSSPVVEGTAIDDVVLGAPLDGDSIATNDTPYLPTVSPITIMV